MTHSFIVDVHLCYIFFSLASLPPQSQFYFPSIYLPHLLFYRLISNRWQVTRWLRAISLYSRREFLVDAQYQFQCSPSKNMGRIFHITLAFVLVPIQYWTKCVHLFLFFVYTFHNSFSFRLFNILLTSLFHFIYINIAPNHLHHHHHYKAQQ